MLVKDSEIEQSIPFEWRAPLSEVVEAIKSRNLISWVDTTYEVRVDQEEIESIYDNLDAYGGTLVSLPEATWATSVCRWMDGYWHVLLDLFTLEEGASDLVLFVDIYEMASLIQLRVQSLHVP